MSSPLSRATLKLNDERKRSGRYFERMTTGASNLADIRRALGVSNKPNWITMETLHTVLEYASHWVAYSDAHPQRWEAEIKRQEGSNAWQR